MRRKELGYATSCFYCPESELFCLENDHPLTEELDPLFKRVDCRNCHRKLEARRDLKGLTKNGRRDVHETEREKLRRFLLLVAEDQETIAEAVTSTPPPMVAQALIKTAAALRRKADSLPQWMFPTTDSVAVEWDGAGCA
jgi:hypothetical protein